MHIPQDLEDMIAREAAGQRADAFSITDEGVIYFHASEPDQLGFRHEPGRVRCGRIQNGGVTFTHGGYRASDRMAPRVEDER